MEVGRKDAGGSLQQSRSQLWTTRQLSVRSLPAVEDRDVVFCAEILVESSGTIRVVEPERPFPDGPFPVRGGDRDIIRDTRGTCRVSSLMLVKWQETDE